MEVSIPGKYNIEVVEVETTAVFPSIVTQQSLTIADAEWLQLLQGTHTLLLNTR
jgi:hypothetical protein